MIRTAITAGLAMFVFFALATPATAQRTTSGWGVQGTFTPMWKVPQQAVPLFGDALLVEGDEFRVGVVRGRTLGGDWGVSYVRKKVTDGSFVSIDEITRSARHVTIDGIAVDKFTPFGTIKERVQIGLMYGAGVGWAKGEVTETDLFTGQIHQAEASHLLAPFNQPLRMVPLARLELAVTAITVAGLKVRASGGFNYPGVARFTLGGLYLFGH